MYVLQLLICQKSCFQKSYKQVKHEKNLIISKQILIRNMINLIKGGFPFKGAVSRDFLSFFISWIEAIWAPNKQSKMVLLKNSFSWRYLRNQWLCAVLACAESDSAEANTARSPTPCRLTLRGVKLIFSIFENLHFQGF